jgi:ecotin
MKTLAALALAAVVASAPARAADPLQAFPPAEASMKRFVITVPKLDDEDAARVELIVGKTVSVDEHNRFRFGGKLEKETLKGWGYDRYILRKLGPMAGTLIAVDPNAPKVERFVALAGEATLPRYNSRMPLVVYVPADVEVRYRIWRADPTTAKAQVG